MLCNTILIDKEFYGNGGGRVYTLLCVAKVIKEKE